MPGLLSRMRTAAIVIGNLPEEPGYNGSRLVIDDTEADEIEKAIDAAVAEVERLRAELARRNGEIAYQLTKRLVIDMPTARAAVDEAFGHNAKVSGASTASELSDVSGMRIY